VLLDNTVQHVFRLEGPQIVSMHIHNPQA